MESSSSNLHPDDGGRFVFERVDDGARYSIEVFLPQEICFKGSLRITESGTVQMELPCDVDWVIAETEKLARVVKRTRQQRLLRWRPQP